MVFDSEVVAAGRCVRVMQSVVGIWGKGTQDHESHIVPGPAKKIGVIRSQSAPLHASCEVSRASVVPSVVDDWGLTQVSRNLDGLVE